MRHQPAGATRVLAILVVGALSSVACSVETGRPGPTPAVSVTDGGVIPADLPRGEPPSGLGTDPELNKLASECFRGILKACDDLVRSSEPKSEYERYGATCGRRNEPVGSCVKRYPTPFSVDVSTKAGRAQGTPTGVIADARMAGHEGFDRVVLQFTEGGLPAYTVTYAAQQSVPVLGDENPLSGEAILSITIAPATFNAPLPFRMKSDTSNIIEVAVVSTEAGRMTWMVALHRKTGFEVSTLLGPPRLVLDVSTL